MDISIAQGLLLWELQGKSVDLAQTASSFLVILYAISYLITNKGCFFAVFLFDEVISYSFIADIMSEPQYYLMVAFIYCALYWYIESKNIQLKTIVACGIIVLFNAGMSVDASINAEIKTFLYTYYIYFVVLLHLYLISTLFGWQLIRKSMGSFFDACCHTFGISDAFAFLWYNTITIKNQTSQEWRIQTRL